MTDRSPSPGESGLWSSFTSSPSCVRSRISSSRTSRTPRRRSSATSSVQIDQDAKQADAIWVKAQQEWKALKRLALRQREQEVWVELLSDERAERLAIAPDMKSRRTSLVRPMRCRSEALVSSEDSTSVLLSSSMQFEEAAQERIPAFVCQGRSITPEQLGSEGSYLHWRRWFRGIYTEAKAVGPPETDSGDVMPLEASCFLCCKR